MRTYWREKPETWLHNGAQNADLRQQFEATQSSVKVVVSGVVEATFAFPSGYQPAGEGFAHAVGENPVRYYQPAVRGTETSWQAYDNTTASGWTLVPVLLVLDMADLSLLDEIDLAPVEASVNMRYRDSYCSGSVHGLDGIRQAGQVPWAYVGGAQGDIYGVIRIGDWVLPQYSRSNQVNAVNLAHGRRINLPGWNAVPTFLASIPTGYDPLDPHGDAAFSFDSASQGNHTRRTYDVIGPCGPTSVLVGEATTTLWGRAISGFPDYFLEYRRFLPDGSGATVRNLFADKWINGSGGAYLVTPDDPDDVQNDIYYDTRFENNTEDFECGHVKGTPFAPVFGPVPKVSPPDAAAAAQILTTCNGDIDEVCNAASWRGTNAVGASYRVVEIEFPLDTDGGAIFRTLFEKIDSAQVDSDFYDAGPLAGGKSVPVSEYGISYAEMNLQPAGPQYPRNWVFGPQETPFQDGMGNPVPGHTSNTSRLEDGVGVWMHEAIDVPYSENTTSRDPQTGGYYPAYFWIRSMDSDRCAPPGVWLFRNEDGVQPIDNRDDLGRYLRRDKCLTRLWQRYMVMERFFPKPAAWHTGRYCTDGDTLIFLPRDDLREALSTYVFPYNDPDFYSSSTWSNALTEKALIQAFERDQTGAWVSTWSLNTVGLAGLATVTRNTTGVGTEISSRSGAVQSNPVMTARYMYCVVNGDWGGGLGERQHLVKINLYETDDDNGDTIPAGKVLGSVPLTTRVDFEGEVYRDPLIVVNRRLIGVGLTTFFEITGALQES